MIIRDLVAKFHDLRVRCYYERIVSKALLGQQGRGDGGREKSFVQALHARDCRGNKMSVDEIAAINAILVTC